MAIKVTLGATENTQQEKPFPKLMIVKSGGNVGMIVLFTCRGKGTIIANPKTHGLFQTIDCWAMQTFTDYNEPITIQNQ